jgi:5'-methylthioadenosine phosphorylase
MAGPAFSTKAESHTYRSHGFDVIGMTSLAEAKLCREAEICYQAMAMITDYDCWHETHEAVTVDMVIGHLMANTALAKEVLVDVLHTLPETREACGCGSALSTAIITQPDAMPEDTREALMPILAPYL